MLDRDQQNINEFKKRKVRQFIASAIGLGLAISLGYLGRNGGIVIGSQAYDPMVILLLGIVGLVVFSLVNWRCPACNAYLGKNLFLRFCPQCGTRLGSHSG